MKIFLSYRHDLNAPLIEKIKDFLSKDADGNLKHEVWIDSSEIKPMPIIFDPCAELDSDMKLNYHFGEI